MPYSSGMQIIEFDSFITAFPVKPGEEAAVKRRFMTLFAQDEGPVQAGGTSYVRQVRSFTGEVFALKRLITSGFTAGDAALSKKDSARITKGHVEAFYEEYKNQLLVSHMRGFPKLYGYGQIGGDPAIVMEWIEGVSLRELERRRREEGLPVGGEIVAEIGVAVLEALYSIERLDSTLAHRDISSANIMIRTDAVSLEDQIASGEFDVCLIDFGSASARTADDPSFTMVSQVWRNGTPAYAPPEMLTQDLPHIDELRKSQAIDVFALCSVLYELYSGRIPWDLGVYPSLSPFRVKVEHEPDPLVAQEPHDAPLVAAIASGLAIEQGDRPGVGELLRLFDGYLAAIGATGAGGADGAGSLQQGEGTTGEGGGAAAAGKRTSIRGRVLPVGLYTPDSTRLEMAPVDAGGKRAGENVPAFEKPRGITRRSLIVGGLALAIAAVAGGGAVARFAPKPGYDFSAYPIASALWDGVALYPAMQSSEAAWHLLDAGSSARVALDTDREPGRFKRGLIKVHDSASGGYGFLTAVQGSDDGALSSAWAILPRYANAGDFSDTESLAAVQDADSGLWGYVDEKGETRIPAAYAQVGRFSNGYAAVRPPEQTLWGVIDATGKEALKPRFEQLGMFSAEGLAAAIVHGEDAADRRWGFVDLNGDTAIPGAFASVQRFTEGLAACLMDAEKSLWGYIDSNGEVVVPARFSAAYPFADGLAPAKDAELSLWGLIDTNGAWHVAPRYLSLGEKTGDLFPAHGSPIDSYDTDDGPGSAWDAYWKEGNGDSSIAYGYIDDTGTWIFKPSFGDTLIRHPES